MVRTLLAESLDRTGRIVTGVSLIVGAVAGLLIGSAVHVTDAYWTNAAICIVLCEVVAFIVDFLFISPIRLWQSSERDKTRLEAEVTALHLRPPEGIHIEHIDQFFNVIGPGFGPLAQGSNTIIRTPYGVGPLFPANEIDGYITASAQIASGGGSANDATVLVSRPENED